MKQSDDGRWTAEVDYFYTGAPAGGGLSISLPAAPSAASAPAPMLGYRMAARGRQRVTIPLSIPISDVPKTTHKVIVQLASGSQALATRQVDQSITWPDFATVFREREFTGKMPQEVLERAVALIDNGSAAEAKPLLEHLLSKNGKFDAAYVELARVAMKTNWGPEGLHQAENLLASALQIRPDNVNAKILLGYVRTHQGRSKDAEALFAEAATAKPENRWLWANWGELLARQGKRDAAIQKYREAVAGPRVAGPNDRARLDAYAHMLALLDPRKEMAEMEALYQQRAMDFGPGSCYSAEYARFLLSQGGDTAKAIALARESVGTRCSAESARETLGLAYYVAWMSSTGAPRDEALRQARVFLPAGPALLYQLATSERTVEAARQLKASGENIDQRDNRHYTALAHALEHRDSGATERLLRLGARPDALIGHDDMPIALLPVLASDFEGIRLMRQYGVDYSKLRFGGSTAIDHAKRIGNQRLLDALTGGRAT
jgi:Tfp pilus assembly protein PilF